MQDGSRAMVAGHIRDFGQHVVGVAGGAGDPYGFQPFVPTIGNHEAGLPELLLIGSISDVYRRILNALGRMQRERGSPFRHGEIVDYTARLPALIGEAGQDGRDEYAVQAGVYYRTDVFEVRQVLLPDQNGRYPGDPGCLLPYSEQPVLTRTH